MDDISWAISFLKCHICAGDFTLTSNRLTCSGGHAFSYGGNVVDLSPAVELSQLQKRSQRSFEIEWTSYYNTLGWTETELVSEKESFLTYTKSMPNFFADKIVLDAGCGNGRYINIVNRISFPQPRLIIGVDVSNSIFVAAKNCAMFTNVLLVKADLNLLPKLLKKRVDYVYSIGVLHHTPNAKESFGNLAKCIKPCGFLSLYLYGKGNQLLYRINSFLRNHFFKGWPHQLIWWLCVLVAIPSQIFRVKFFGPWMLDLISRVIFVSPDVHNMFDAYTAGYTSFHEKGEVENWYLAQDFDCVVESQQNHTALYCIGRKMAQPCWSSKPVRVSR